MSAALIKDFDPGKDEHLVRLAKEVAINHYPLETILERYNLTLQTWEYLSRTPRFNALLDAEKLAWEAAMNTPQRVKLKSATVIEMWLEEAYNLLHDKKELLSSKVSLATLIGKFAALDQHEKATPDAGVLADRVNITIKIGNEAMQFGNVTSQVIEGEYVEQGEAPADFDWDEEFEPSPSENAHLFFEEGAYYEDEEEPELVAAE